MPADEANVYVELMKTRFGQFNKRRDIELKINFGIWTFLGVIVGFVLTDDKRQTIPPVLTCVIVVVLFTVFAVYTFWMWKLHSTNVYDRMAAYLAQDRAEEMLGVPQTHWLSGSIETKGDIRRPAWEYFWAEVIITLLFTILCVLSITLFYSSSIPCRWG